VAGHFVQVAKALKDKKLERKARSKWRDFMRNAPDKSKPPPFSTEELRTALHRVKIGMAPGYDNIHPEFLQHLGPIGLEWLANFSHVTCESKIPKIWRQTKVIALENPGKDPNVADNYHLISLLSVCYKLLERLVLERISPTVEKMLSTDQVGFRKGRSTCDQVTALTAFIENSFQ
jgi:hypothetical protein